MDFGLKDLFTSTDYNETQFEYKDVKQTIYAITHGAPDFDMTGQHVWEGGEIIAKWVIENQDMFKGKTILELGSGTGIGGLVASHFAKKTVMSDYIPEVMDLLKKNILECPHRSEEHQLAVALLDWETTKYNDIVIKTVERDEVGEVTEQETPISEYGNFDMIIAAEVTYLY